MGGAVIIQVVSWLVGYIVLPIGLYRFWNIRWYNSGFCIHYVDVGLHRSGRRIR